MFILFARRFELAGQSKKSSLRRALQDPEFSRRGAGAVRELFTERMRDMAPGEFIESLRAATRQDEWILVAHGAIFGIAGGLLHYAVFGV